MTESREEFRAILQTLRRERERSKSESKAARRKRRALRSAERARVLQKTAGRCHICGGAVEGTPWQADHVLAFSGGGEHGIDNYLPAHALCNNYRWDYLPAEFQIILKLGVWLRTHVEKDTPFGRAAAERFLCHEVRREARRRRRE